MDTMILDNFIPSISFCLILIFTFGCNLESPIGKIRINGIEKKYADYQIIPFREDIRMVTTPFGSDFIFISKGNNVEIIDGDNKSDSIHSLLKRIILDFRKNEIVSLISDSSVCIIFTTYEDSTVEEACASRQQIFKGTRDENNSKSTPCRLGYIHSKYPIKANSLVNKIIKDQKIYRIDSSWYYFRSSRFNEYDSF